MRISAKGGYRRVKWRDLVPWYLPCLAYRPNHCFSGG